MVAPAPVRVGGILDIRVAGEPGLSLTVPLDGAPSLEVGAFIETPRTRDSASQGWEVAETYVQVTV